MRPPKLAPLLLIPALWACGAPPAPDVVLVTVDTLRADRIGAYGASDVATPNVDALAAAGVLFENATAPIPTTKPSHFSLFTSLHPRVHGVLNNQMYLPGDATTFSEVFLDAGYATAGFVATSLLDANSGAGRGFETFDSPRDPWRDAHDVVPLAIRWLSERDPERPYLLWVHLFDAHMPYAPPPERRPPGPPELVRALPVADLRHLLAAAAANGGDLPRPFFERALALYDAEVETVDHWVGELMEAVRRHGRPQDTIVVFTADHGECFEHGTYFDHSNCLYEPATRVPLLIRYPRGLPAEVRRADVVENIDLAPTLLGLARLPVPAIFSGRDLGQGDQGRDRAFLQHPLYSGRVLAHLRENEIPSALGVPARPQVTDGEQTALRTREWKLILTGNEVELYHLPSDPGELEDLSSERPDVARELRRVLETWMTQNPLRILEEDAIDEELRPHLRALGYL